MSTTTTRRSGSFFHENNFPNQFSEVWHNFSILHTYFFAKVEQITDKKNNICLESMAAPLN
jgi:hypothetical protein